MYTIQDLTNIISRLPGIGKKTASRLTFFLIKNKELSKDLITILHDIITNIKPCSICGMFTTEDICEICADSTRDHRILCVIEEQKDLIAIEETNIFNGYYHILSGAINPLEGITPDNLRIQELTDRIKKNPVFEVFIATNPTIEGEATFLYIEKLVQSINSEIKISKIATGIPMGGSLEYSDKHTLSKAILQKQYI